MSDEHLRTAVDRINTALVRIEAALARPRRANAPSYSDQSSALAALEQRHAALRQVMTDSVGELDSLLAAAGGARASDPGQ